MLMNVCFQPKIQVASKYERRVDTRSYDDKKKLFEGVSILETAIQTNMLVFDAKEQNY